MTFQGGRATIMEFFRQLLSPDFMPHGFCYLWDPRILWLHVISDGLITLSYYCIPIVLIYFIRKNRDLPFNRIFWMFGAFILACGTTHLLEIWNVWHGSYLVAGVIKAITAAVSVITVAMLIPLVPKVISLPGRMHLQEENRKLEREIAARARIEAPIEAPLRRRVTGGFMVAVLLTVLLGFSSWRNARLAADEADWMGHTSAVMETLEVTAKHVIEAETSARTFALIGQDPLLAHYRAARGAVAQNEDALRHLTADNPDQQRRLDVLAPQVRAALEFAERIVAKRQQTHATPGADEILETERLMDAVRATTQEMHAEETRLLSQRTQRTTAGRRLTSFIIVVGIFVGAGLLALARIAVNREIDVSARARAQIGTLNAELEQRVEQRTAALQSEIAERKRAEDAVKESLATSETALKELADQKFALDQHALVAVTDVQGTITYVNDKFCAVSQYSEDELLGQNHRILNSGHHPREFFQQMYHTIANGKVWHSEIKNRAKDGSIYWVDTTIVPTLSTEGKPRQYVAIRADITERKRAEEELHESQERFRLLLDGVKDYAIYMLDPEGHVISWNEGAARLKGYQSEEILGKHFSCFYVPEDREADRPSRELHESLSKGRFEEQAQRVRKDGSTFWANVVITPMYDDSGTLRGFSKVARDITQQKADEQEIRKLNDELEHRVAERTAQLETANQELADQKFALDQHAIVAMTDVQGTITYVNDKFCAISQYSKGELIGQNHRMMNSGHHPKEFFQQMYRTIAHGQVWHGEIKNRAKDGSTFWLDTTIVPFVGAEGKPRQYAAIRTDITERTRAEERVLQRTAELETANKELEAFSYSVSHDLRAPLRHISGFSKMLMEEFGSTLDPSAQHYVERIQAGTQKMGLLVDELLNLARVGRQALNRQPTRLNSMVAEVIAILQPESEGRQVEWVIADLPEVNCDPVLIRQIFQNLLANALKFTRPRVRAIIEVSHKENEEGGQLVFMVRDNGIGFNMKYVEKLFGVFQRLHSAEEFEGTGIGLVTVQRIVHKHGGRVWAEAELDKGAAFYFTLGVGKQVESKTNGATAGGQS